MAERHWYEPSWYGEDTAERQLWLGPVGLGAACGCEKEAVEDGLRLGGWEAEQATTEKRSFGKEASLRRRLVPCEPALESQWAALE